MKRTLVAAALGLCLAVPSHAADDDAGGLWLTSGFWSKHTSNRKAPRQGWNESNTGLGVEYVFDAHWRLAGGVYENSVYRESRYAQIVWTPALTSWRHDGMRLTLGAAVGAVDGYPRMNGGRAAPTLLPVASIENGRFGANLSYIPSVVGQASGAYAIQFKFKLF
jgi:hypothetical protein